MSLVYRRTNLALHIIVPPNTMAIVSRPGQEAEPLEVGSGIHSWSHTYQDSYARGPLSVDDPIGEIADIPEAWTAVMDDIARLAPRNHFLKYGLLTQRNTSLRQALEFLPNSVEVLTEISDALSKL